MSDPASTTIPDWFCTTMDGHLIPSGERLSDSTVPLPMGMAARGKLWTDRGHRALKIGFIGGSKVLRARVLETASDWCSGTCLTMSSDETAGRAHIRVSFEPSDLVSRVMSYGAPTPIEVAVSGPSLPASREFAEKVAAKLRTLPNLRDVHIAQSLDYPTIDVNVDRERAGLLGVRHAEIGNVLDVSHQCSPRCRSTG
jgi:hypothetical protein